MPHAHNDGPGPASPGQSGGVVALIGPGPLPWIIVNALVEAFGPITVIVEDKESTRALFRRRLRKLGLLTVAGQLAFGIAQKLTARRARTRVGSLIATERLNPEPDARCTIIRVPSVNTPECREALHQLQPAAVAVVGTRIISAATLAAVPAPFINYHAGINPKYRGMYGGYWALATGDAANAGVTVHLVDEGVDTGSVLYTAPFAPTPHDNVVSYFYLQAAAARPLMVRALKDALAGDLRPVATALPSKQWFHPTLWAYAWTGIRCGVW